MDISDIEKLAKLSRLELRDEEKQGVLKDLQSILGYVSEINSVVASTEERSISDLRNVVRADENPHTRGEFTEDILNNAPDKQDGYIKVKQVFE